MDRRFLIFFLLSFTVLMANALWVGRQEAARRAQKGPAQVAKAPAVAEQAERPEGAQQREAEDADGDDDPVDAGQPPAEREPDVSQSFVTLGSIDPGSQYRMLATLTNRGAAVRRIELSNRRYLDLHDRSGYLGHLELADDGGRGLVVQAVGAGTPAAKAQLRVGDRIVGAGLKQPKPIATSEELADVLRSTKPKQELRLDVLRDEQELTLTAKLTRRPLEVIRPESENVLMRGDPLPPGFVEPPSFLLTLHEIDGETIGQDGERDGVDLLTANWRIVDKSDREVSFERRVPKYGLIVTKRYRLAQLADDASGDPDAPAYHLTLAISVTDERTGENPPARSIAYQLDGPNGLPIEGWWYAVKGSRNWGSPGLRDIVGRYFGAAPNQQNAPAIVTGDAKPFEGGSLAYMGVDAQYFAAALIPQKKGVGVEEEWIAAARSVLLGPAPDRRTAEGRYANVTPRLISKTAELRPGEPLTHEYTIFAGPKRPELLSKYVAADEPAYNLSDFVYYGWFGGVAKAMVGLLHVFYSVVGNYGLAIIMLTALVRGCMFPVSRGQAKSMAKLQELRPEMERIKERFKGDQQKQAQAMQQLYRKHNVNPLGGCLPMLIQLPVFIGLYRGLSVDVELRQASLFGPVISWCSNLAAPDMFWNWSAIMPKLVTRGENFFGLGPYLNLLPLVTIVLFLWQQKMFMPEPTNEQAALQQKIMKYMMIFMGLLFYKVPSGLCIYFIASSLWGIGERKLFPPPAVGAVSASGAAPPSGEAKSAPVAPVQKRSGKNGAADSERWRKAKRRK